MPEGVRTVRLKKKKVRKRRIVLVIFTPILILLLVSAGYGAFLYNKAKSVAEQSYKPVNAASQHTAKFDNVSLLLLGIDDSETRHFGKGTRTDAMMVLTINKKNNSVKLLSIPRDSYVNIPGRTGKDKINAANAYGGTDLAIQTVRNFLNIPIDYYVKMNFNAFMDVVDALGGIQVDVPYNISEQNSKDQPDAIKLMKGMQHLNGEQALALARTRHQDNDIYRGLRQQQIVKAIIKKAVSVNGLTKESKVLDAVGKNLETNLTFDDMKSFIALATTSKNINVQTLKLEGSDATIDGVYYYKVDPASLAKDSQILQKQLNVKPESPDGSGSGTSGSQSGDSNSAQSSDGGNG